VPGRPARARPIRSRTGPWSAATDPSPRNERRGPQRRAAPFGCPRPAIAPLGEIEFVDEPRLSDRIEWFGSAHDIARACAALWRHRDTPVGAALSIQDGDIRLDRTRFPTAWFKGGSEPGVLTMHHLAANTAGQVAITSVLLRDPARSFAETQVRLEAAGAVAGAIQLAL
jgi:hypothetical protein